MWTLCSEEMPRDIGEYLCVVATDYGGYDVSILYFDGLKFDTENFVWGEAVSWQPLPEIPKYKRVYVEVKEVKCEDERTGFGPNC